MPIKCFYWLKVIKTRILSLFELYFCTDLARKNTSLFCEQKWENPTIVYCREEPRSSAVHPLLHFFTLPNSSQLTLVIFKIQRIRFLMLVKFRFSEKTRKFEKTFLLLFWLLLGNIKTKAGEFFQIHTSKLITTHTGYIQNLKYADLFYFWFYPNSFQIK